jgi:hypothetical protein
VRLDEAFRLARVAIAGGPKHGKSTLADKIANGRQVIRTDDLDEELKRERPELTPAERWSMVSTLTVVRCEALGEYVVEGVRVPHALRKGLLPDVVLWCDVPRDDFDPEKHGPTVKGVTSVFRDWRAMNELRPCPVPILIP